LYQCFFFLPMGEYQEFINGEWVSMNRLFTRAEADAILRYMAELGGMGTVKAKVEELSVKVYPPNWGKEAQGRKQRENAA
jgi:hypothetical protein